MKRTIAAASAALALASAAPAFAADFILTETPLIEGGSDPVFSNFYVNIDKTPTSISALLSNAPASGAFIDRFIFAPTFTSVGSGSSTTDFIANIVWSNPGLRVDAYDITAPGVAAALSAAFTATTNAAYTAAVATLTAYLNGPNGTNEPFNPANSSSQPGSDDPTPLNSYIGTPNLNGFQLNGVSLETTKFYVITLDGTNNADIGGYSGTLTATTVPEPATWAMMLAGFGLIGFAMRRQRQPHPKVRFAF